MPVRNRAGALGIFLQTAPDQELRVGTLTRDATGEVEFKVDAAYIGIGEDRPVTSLAWKGADDAQSIARLRTTQGKVARGIGLPPYFDNLLPEGTLLTLVEREFGTGDFDRYDVLARLGADLPGAVIARREAGEALPVVPVEDFDADNADEKPISFSLAGVQLKFSMKDDKRRLTIPGQDGGGDLLLKLPTKQFPGLVETEFTSMQLAGLAGVNVSEAWMVESDKIQGIPEQFLKHGTHALAIRRFDRAPDGVRIHTEDFAQILGAVDQQKYFMANQETLVNVTKRFSSDPFGDVFEAIRRLVVDIMVGNGDGHLKNWSFIFPDGVHPRLSPAYDIVSTLTYLSKDKMALKFAGTANPRSVSLAHIKYAAKIWKIDVDGVEREVRLTVERIMDIWPDALKGLPAADNVKETITKRWSNLRLIRDVRPAIVPGKDIPDEANEEPTTPAQ